MVRHTHFNTLAILLTKWFALFGSNTNVFDLCFPLQWGSKAFKNLQILPPCSGIVHQV